MNHRTKLQLQSQVDVLVKALAAVCSALPPEAARQVANAVARSVDNVKQTSESLDTAQTQVLYPILSALNRKLPSRLSSVERNLPALVGRAHQPNNFIAARATSSP